MDKFKGLHIPKEIKFKNKPVAGNICGFTTTGKCPHSFCFECIFSGTNSKKRLKYYNHLQAQKIIDTMKDTTFKGYLVPAGVSFTRKPVAEHSCADSSKGICRRTSNACAECIFHSTNHTYRLEYYKHLNQKKMKDNIKLDQEAATLTVNGDVFDIVPRKPEYVVGGWYLISNETRSKLGKVKSQSLNELELHTLLDETGQINNCQIKTWINIDMEFTITKATDADFLKFGYKLMNQVQPWDDKIQEFLVKDKDMVLCWDGEHSLGFQARIYVLEEQRTHTNYNQEETIPWDNYLPATSENFQQMSKYMKGNLK